MTATFTPAPELGDPTPGMLVEIWDASLTTRLVESLSIDPEKWSIDDVMSDTGLLTGEVGVDDATEHFAVGNHLVVALDREDSIVDSTAFVARIEAPWTVTSISLDGAAAEVITFSFRGWVAELEDVPILPYGGVDAKPQAASRPCSWCSPEADLSVLDPVAVLYTELSAPWQTPQTDPPWFKPWLPPKGFPDYTCQHIWSSFPDPVEGHPPQTRRFVRDYTISQPGLYAFWAFADDGFRLFAQGAEIGKGAEAPADSFITPWTGCWELTTGTLRIGIEGYNYQRPETPAVGTFGGPNVGRVGFALYYLPDGVNTVIGPEHLVGHTDGDWLTLDTDDPLPAPNPHQFLSQLLTDAQTENMAVGVELSSTATHDSKGNPWTSPGDMEFPIGEDTGNLLGVLRKMASAGVIDWHARGRVGEKVIDIAAYGTLGTSYTVTPEEPGVPEATEVKETRVAGQVSSLLVRSKDGLAIVEDSEAVAEIGRVRKSLPLADLTMDAAITQARRELDIRKVERTSIAAEVDFLVDDALFRPYDNLFVGDTVPMDGASGRIMRMRTSFDASGRPIFVPELRTRVQEAAERQQIALSKASSMNGTSRTATVLDGLSRGVVAGFVKPLEPIVFTQIQLTPEGLEAAFDRSNTRKWEVPARIHRIDLRQDVPPQQRATRVQLIRVNPGGSSVVATLELGVGKFKTTDLPHYLHVGLLDEIYINITQHDDASEDDPEADARWLRMDVFAVDARPATVEPAKVDVPW